MKTCPSTKSGQTLIVAAVTILVLVFLCSFGLHIGLMYRETARLDRAAEAVLRSIVQLGNRTEEEIAITARHIAAGNCPSLQSLPSKPTSSRRLVSSQGVLSHFIFERPEGGSLQVQLKTDPVRKEVLSVALSLTSPEKPFMFSSPTHTVGFPLIEFQNPTGSSVQETSIGRIGSSP